MARQGGGRFARPERQGLAVEGEAQRPLHVVGDFGGVGGLGSVGNAPADPDRVLEIGRVVAVGAEVGDLAGDGDHVAARAQSVGSEAADEGGRSLEAEDPCHLVGVGAEEAALGRAGVA